MLTQAMWRTLYMHTLFINNYGLCNNCIAERLFLILIIVQNDNSQENLIKHLIFYKVQKRIRFIFKANHFSINSSLNIAKKRTAMTFDLEVVQIVLPFCYY